MIKAQHPILFVVSQCISCDKVKPQVIEFFEKHQTLLEVRKPHPIELAYLRQIGVKVFPALYLPQARSVITGEELPDWLRKNENGDWISNRECDGANSGPARL